MNSVKETIMTNASQDHCFKISHDYSIRSIWDTFVKESKILDKDEISAEPKRVWVKDRRGLTMTVDYTSYKPPKNAAMKMVTGPFFFSNFGGAWIFKKISEDTTETIFSYSFSLKWWLFPYITSPIVKFILKRDINRRIHSFKEYCEKTYDDY